MTCSHGIIFHETNAGTYAEPKIEVRVQCNGPAARDCGFDVPFIFTYGVGKEIEEHTPQDWWVCSEDFEHYTRLHEEHRNA